MAEGERLADEDVAVAVVGVVVEVAAAEACRGDADLKFVCFWGLEIAGFLEKVCQIAASQFVCRVFRTVLRSFAPWRTEAWTCVDMVGNEDSSGLFEVLESRFKGC